MVAYLYEVRWFQHFSRSIRPGFRRLVVESEVDSVLASAWIGPKGRFLVIFISTGKDWRQVDLEGYPSWVGTQESNIYVSTLDKRYYHAGILRKRSLVLEPRSITTVESK